MLDHERGRKHNLNIIRLIKEEIHKPVTIYNGFNTSQIKRYPPSSFKYVCRHLRKIKRPEVTNRLLKGHLGRCNAMVIQVCGE